MFDVVAAVNDDQILTRNLLRSSFLRYTGVTLQLQKGYRCAGTAYNAALQRCRNELLVFAHQDVYIPVGWDQKILRAIAHLEHTDPTWATLGVFGVTATANAVGHVWSSGINRVLGAPFEYPSPVDSFDELVLLVRRSSGIAFDEHLPGYHLYGTDLVQTALAQNRGAYVVCAPVIHNSKPILYLDSNYFKAHRYLAQKWRDRLPIQNCILPIARSSLPCLKMRLLHVTRKLRSSNVDRRSLDRNYDCVELAQRLGFE